MNTFLLLIWLVLAALLASGSRSLLAETSRTISIVAVAVILQPGLSSGLRRTFDLPRHPEFPVRMEVEESLAERPAETTKGARTYVLWNGTVGFRSYISMYGLSRRGVNGDCFSIGPRRNESDVWTCEKDLVRFQQELSAFDFLLLGKVGHPCIDTFGSLFAAPPVEGWSRVTRDNPGAAPVLIREPPLPAMPCSAEWTGPSLELRKPFSRIGSGHAFVATEVTWWQLRDTDEQPNRSPAILCEDNKRLTQAHSLHDDIITKGQGRFSHYGDGVTFSASDNTDPNSNGRSYWLTLPK